MTNEVWYLSSTNANFELANETYLVYSHPRSLRIGPYIPHTYPSEHNTVPIMRGDTEALCRTRSMPSEASIQFRDLHLCTMNWCTSPV